MSKPVFVCVPGASHSPLIYGPLRAALSIHGYTAIPLSLPSVGGNPPTYDFTEDVNAIRTLVTQLADAGEDIILVLHAYGGLPGGEALQGLGKVERGRRNLRGGVVRLVFIMSWMALEGFQGSPRGDVSSMFPYMLCNLKVSGVLAQKVSMLPRLGWAIVRLNIRFGYRLEYLDPLKSSNSNSRTGWGRKNRS